MHEAANQPLLKLHMRNEHPNDEHPDCIELESQIPEATNRAAAKRCGRWEHKPPSSRPQRIEYIEEHNTEQPPMQGTSMRKRQGITRSCGDLRRTGANESATIRSDNKVAEPIQLPHFHGKQLHGTANFPPTRVTNHAATKGGGIESPAM